MEFLEYIKAEKYPCISQVMFFSCSEIPTCFISGLVKKLQQDSKYPVFSLDLASQDLNQIKKTIATFFLSGPVIYFLKNFNNLNLELKKKLRDFLSKFEGPNFIVYFDTDKNFSSIDIPIKISLNIYELLFKFFYPTVSHNPIFIRKLFSLNKEYPIDEACMLMRYELVVGQNAERFFGSWSKKIIEQDKSLFRLSQYLFEFEQSLFLEKWLNIKDNYPIEFWIAFWSDQIFQAFMFVLNQTNKDIKLGSSNNWKLPFSFVKKNWRLFTPIFLSKAHEFLFNLDFQLKYGVQEQFLELWYFKFLNKMF